jgi:hypothetical protein
MVQALENRMSDMEDIVAHLPDHLNARFAGVDVKMATIRERQLLHTQRFSTLERKFEGLDQRMAGLEGRMGGLEGSFNGLSDRLDEKIDLILQRLPAQ